MNPLYLGNPIVGVTRESLLYKSMKAMQHNIEKMNDNVENHRFETLEARISRSVTYMVLLRHELAKQTLSSSLSLFSLNRHLYRLDIKKGARALVNDISKYDHMTGTIINGKTLEYYDGLTDHYCMRMQDKVKHCQQAMDAIMAKQPEYSALVPDTRRLLCSLHLSVVLVGYCFERMDFEIEHYKQRCLPLERLRFLSLRNMYFRADGLLAALQRTLFGKRDQVTVTSPEVDGLDSLLLQMASPEHIDEIIREYDKEFDGTPFEGDAPMPV